MQQLELLVIELGSLPHRQLRNDADHAQGGPVRSLPHRQLRNSLALVWVPWPGSLPHRQLRNKKAAGAAVRASFTAA